MTDQANIDISDLSKAKVLAALFNATAPSGMGFLQAAYGPEVMTVEYAEQIVGVGNTATPDMGGFEIPGRQTLYFDYVYGRCLKVDLTEDSFDPWGFDRDNGEGSAQKVIDRLRETGDVNSTESQEASAATEALNAHQAMQFANTPNSVEGNVFTMGGDDVGAALQQAVDAAVDRRRS